MESFFDQPYFRMNKFLMSGLGIWPEQSLFMRCVLPAMCILFFVSVIIPEVVLANGVIEVVRIHDMWGHINIIIETMVPIFIIVIVTSKLLNGSFNVRKMRTILDQIECHWAQMQKSPNIEILRKHGHRAQFGTLAITMHQQFGNTTDHAYANRIAVYVYVCTVLFLTLPLLPIFLDIVMPLNESRPRDLLFQAEYRIDHDKYFFEILFHASVTSVIAMSIIVAVDAMFFTIVEHGCGLFEIVGANIKKGDLSIDHSDNDDRKKICYYVDLHKEALRFADLIESNYSMAFTPVIGVSLLALSVTGVQLVLNMDSLKDVVRYGMFVIGQMVHVLFNSICGQRIFDYSLSVTDSVYGSDWINFSTKNKKLLIAILLRSQRPCVLTAGKIYILSMASFSSVMQTACSYFTVLTTMV